jgi:hypothetical protein
MGKLVISASLSCQMHAKHEDAPLGEHHLQLASAPLTVGPVVADAFSTNNACACRA